MVDAMFFTKEPIPVPNPAARLDQPDWLLIGCQLKAKREQMNKAEADVADELCLSVKQIKAMDCGKIWPFPSGACHQWCVQRYATAVGLVWDELYACPDEPVHSAIDDGTPDQTTVLSQSTRIANQGSRASLVSKHFIVSLLLVGILASLMIGARLIENEPTRPSLESKDYPRHESNEKLRQSEAKI